jgi:hypothetical protein
MFSKPTALFSARCYLGQHAVSIGDRCDCNCHVPSVIGNPVWNAVGVQNRDDATVSLFRKEHPPVSEAMKMAPGYRGSQINNRARGLARLCKPSADLSEAFLQTHPLRMIRSSIGTNGRRNDLRHAACFRTLVIHRESAASTEKGSARVKGV